MEGNRLLYGRHFSEEKSSSEQALSIPILTEER
jgi:hypothetical protein